MRYIRFILVAAATCFMPLLVSASSADASAGDKGSSIKNFVAVHFEGKVRIKTGDGEYVAIKKGGKYAFGSTVKTGKFSLVDLEFSKNNTFRLLARTTLTITENARNPKLKILKLEKGAVSLKLDNFPKDHKLKVETPTAVCGAVGTRFEVSFDADEKKADKKAINRFSCEKGEVFAASRFTMGGNAVESKTFNVPSMKEGVSIAATIYEGSQNSYTDITVNRGRLMFHFGGTGGSQLLVESKDKNKAVRFVCSLEKSAVAVDRMAMKVENGTVTATRFIPKGFMRKEKTETKKIDSAHGAVVLSHKKKTLQLYVAPKGKKIQEAEDYLAAAKAEGMIYDEVEELKADGGKADQVQAAEVRLKAAADKATRLRNSLLNKRVRKMLQQIRRVNRARTPRRR